MGTVTESCLPSMAPCSHHWQKAQSCHFQQESGRDLCQQPSVPLGVALSVLPSLLPRDMWKSGCLWSWGHRLPCWKVPREGRQQHASAQIPADLRPLPPQCPGGGCTPSPLAFRSPRVPLPPPAERMLPCEPGWGSPGSREAQRGPEPCDLGPAPCPCLPGHQGDLGFMLLGCMG